MDKDIIPKVSITTENLDTDLQERLRGIVQVIQKISSKIGVHSILTHTFNREAYLKKLCEEFCDLKGRSDVCSFRGFEPNEICIITRLPDSLYSKNIVPTNYPVTDTIIFCTFNRAFHFDDGFFNEDDHSNNHEAIYWPQFITWEDAIISIQRTIGFLNDEIPKVNEL